MDVYNFSNINDLRHFISIILDDYCPTQLEQIDSDLIYDAIKSLKSEHIDLTGNLIYIEAVCFGVNKADEKIKNWRDYIDENEIDKEQINLLDSFANKINDGGLIECGIIDYFANGSLDSSVFFSSFISPDDKEALKIINNNSDILNDLSEDIPIDISNFENKYENVFEKDITEDY